MARTSVNSSSLTTSAAGRLRPNAKIGKVEASSHVSGNLNSQDLGEHCASNFSSRDHTMIGTRATVRRLKLKGQ